MRPARFARGVSLVEITIVLLVLTLLVTALGRPTGGTVAGSAISRRGMTKVQQDCEAIGLTLMRLVRDVGPCLRSEAGADCLLALYGEGRSGGGDWPEQGGNMDEQFVRNEHAGRPIYPPSTWRGAYLAGPVGPDPWGTRYGVNVMFLVPRGPVANFAIRPVSSTFSVGATGVAMPWGDLSGPEADVVCLSAGPNRVYETPFAGSETGAAAVHSDDVVYVIQGSQRPILY